MRKQYNNGRFLGPEPAKLWFSPSKNTTLHELCPMQNSQVLAQLEWTVEMTDILEIPEGANVCWCQYLISSHTFVILHCESLNNEFLATVKKWKLHMSKESGICYSCQNPEWLEGNGGKWKVNGFHLSSLFGAWLHCVIADDLQLLLTKANISV